MNNISSVWGGITGKIIASALILAIICAAVSVTLAYSTYGDKLVSKDEIKVISSTDNNNGTLAVKFRINKQGHYLSEYKTYTDGDKLMVRLYSSVREGDIKADSAGAYTINFKVDKNLKSIVQEGPGDEEYILVKVDVES